MFARFLLAGVAFGSSLVSGAYAAEMNSIASVGGIYFEHRVEIAVPAFAQDDPRWGGLRLGVSTDTLGDEGFAKVVTAWRSLAPALKAAILAISQST
jgi:hypothetical protein